LLKSKIKVRKKKQGKMSEGLELLTDRKDLEAVKKFAFPLCAKFLGGVWNKTTIDEFKVTIMT